MADVSSGNDDKSVGKAGSFKLFARGSSTPSRSSSKMKSNPFSRIFSRKKSENKQSVEDNDGDSSSSDHVDVRKPEGIDVTKVATQPITETRSQEMMIAANTVVEAIQSISAADDLERKPDLVSKPKGLAENPEENIVEKGKEIYRQFTAQEEKASEEMLEKGKEGLKEIVKPFTAIEKTSEEMVEKSREIVNEVKTTSEEKMEKGKKGLKELVNKAVATHKYEKSLVEDQPPLTIDVDDQEKISDVNIVDKSSNLPPKPSNIPPKLQETTVTTVTHSTDVTEDTQNQENAKSEDNDCVASLAEGLQKMCASWNNNNNKNV